MCQSSCCKGGFCIHTIKSIWNDRLLALNDGVCVIFDRGCMEVLAIAFSQIIVGRNKQSIHPAYTVSCVRIMYSSYFNLDSLINMATLFP